MKPQYLLTLTVPPALEENLADWLMQFDPDIGFSSQSVNSHSSREADLSLAEQVAGRKNQTCFQLHIDAERWPGFRENLRREFDGAGLHYRLVPVAESGTL